MIVAAKASKGLVSHHRFAHGDFTSLVMRGLGPTRKLQLLAIQ